MTVSYTSEVADCHGFGNFWRLLFRWRGSVYKLVWLELVAYTVLYSACSAVYRLALNEEGRRQFEMVSRYCDVFSDLIPVAFVLGFYVSIVIRRWWEQYKTLPWPDTLSLFISTSIHGHDRQGRLMRRTIVRYINLSFVLTLTMITPRAKKRFPSLDHIVEAGFMTANEKKIFESLAEKTVYSLYYLPLVWAGTLVARARREGRIRDDFAVKTIIDELNNLRGKCGGLLSYDWISIPLVYTQVVSLAVYTFFLSTIMGRQFLDPAQNYPKNNIDFYFPLFTILQFFFYMGWLKVAESLVNPFGEDDDDFEVNYLIDRNIQVSYLIVDEMHNEHPELTQDIYWDEVFPQELPYTIASEQFRRDPPLGSTANLQVPEAEQEFLPMVDEQPEDEEDENASSGLIFKRRESARSVGSSGRKSSVMSILHNRLFQNTGGSRTSLRRSHKVLNRSVSRASAGSPNTNIKRNNTNTSLQDSNMFRMSDDSLVTMGGKEERGNLKQSQRRSAAHPHATNIHEDEDALLVKIKRFDKDGQEARGSPSEIRWESATGRGKTEHAPPSFTSQISGRSQMDDTNNDGLRKGSIDGSLCSITTSIFHAVDLGSTDYETSDNQAKEVSKLAGIPSASNKYNKCGSKDVAQKLVDDDTTKGASTTVTSGASTSLTTGASTSLTTGASTSLTAGASSNLTTDDKDTITKSAVTKSGYGISWDTDKSQL